MSQGKKVAVDTVGDAVEMFSSAAATVSDAEILPDSDNDSCSTVTINGVPELEYMYGCIATVVGMIIGYYDLNGYKGNDFSNLIAGNVELDARGLDGNIYDMDAFDTNLGSAVVSKEYVGRFIGKTPAQEFQYSFIQSGNDLYLNTSEWNCIADYIGTGQYWRNNGDKSTSYYYGSLADIKNFTFTHKITDSATEKTVAVPAEYIDFLYGLDLYVTSRGYRLDEDKTMNAYVDTYKAKNGTFTFEDYKAEIDAGRCVIVHISDHAMLGYGYDDSTDEIIFDDTYIRNRRMKWGGSYYYSGKARELESVTTIVLDIAGESASVQPPADSITSGGGTVKPTDTVAPTGGKVTLKQKSQNSVHIAISDFYDDVGVKSYEIYLGSTKIGTTTSSSYTYNGKDLGGKLQFNVVAVDAAGNKSMAINATIKIKDTTAPTKVTGLKVAGTPNEKTSVLTWTPAKDNVGVTRYEIKVSGSTKVYKSKTNSVTIKKLTPGTHTFTVTAIDKAKNRSAVSESAAFTVKDIIAPKGGKVKLTQMSQNSVHIAISNFKDSMGVKSYEIYLGSTKVGTTTSSSYTYNGKDLGGKLQFNVVAIDAAGNKSKAKKATIKIKDATVPTKVTGLKVSGTPNEKTSVLTWMPATDNVGVTRYEIKVSGSTKVYKSKTNSITIKKLTPGTHTFTVTALDKAKNRSAVSESATFTVKDITAPKGGRVKLAQSGNTIKFTISNFKDNVGVTCYEIYQGDRKVGVTSSTSYTYNGNLIEGKMSFSVVAVDVAGNRSKAKKASIKVTPVADEPGYALDALIPDSNESIDLTGWNDQNSGLNNDDILCDLLHDDSDGNMLCGTDLIDLGELTGRADNAIGAVDLMNDDLRNKGNSFNGTLA